MVQAITLATILGTGAIVGLVLGLLGGGGSILAVPLLIYGAGMESAHMAIGTSAIAVAVSALLGLIPHARSGRVKWRCATVFAASGVIGALGGAALAKMLPGDDLLALFGALMLVIGLVMLIRRDGAGNPEVRLTLSSAGRLVPLLIIIGLAVGLLSGFFGIGGGFLIVPGLMLATGMPLVYATGTSLVAVAAFGASTATSYAHSGLIDWGVAALFVAGGVGGGLIGATLAPRLAKNREALGTVFALLVIATGGYILASALQPLLG